MAPSFDPARQVNPRIRPGPCAGAGGEPRSRGGGESESDTDRLVIRADTPAPAILLVTDDYAAGWRARPLPGSVQSRYDVMPANYCLRAMPLKAGHHEIMMEYRPKALPDRAVISIAAACAGSPRWDGDRRKKEIGGL